jgi:hypothetical protein
MRTLVALSLAALAAAPAASADRTKDAQALAAATAGRTQGEAISCLQRSRSDNDFKAAGRHLIFRVSPRLTYVNELTPGCDVGDPRQAFVLRSPATRACEGDIVQTVDPLGGAGGGACSLGKFVPYTRP